ncbi:Cof-type HAD-IIB family hydrolase [Butyricicoccus faecihominis]|uniref:Cof-type HAD-IIB family hydrolase n=1 Tax=Butyricicoccaceae TaxID=3085642 RepID=UPI00247AAD33|nr:MULTISPECIES: Cof-type HAD-IIB family hydrolase [Butyricicoccaceae]MCQ5128561.1 Cof-type HAD-IIB family hydrolase [Butyricicoccus faecihominis]WNX83400.1 Cof-type HAD-IIB family hydrolase [Agathobaculum sp. NTUH-O15-33]
MPQYRLIAIDLDGTLLDENSRVPPENARAIRQAQLNGAQVALCTGRNYLDAGWYSEQLLAPADWAVTANGADVRPLPQGEPVLFAGLDDAALAALQAVCAAFGTDPCLYTATHMYYGWEFEKFVRTLRETYGHDIFGGQQRENLIFVQTEDAWREVLRCERGRITKAILYHGDTAVVDEMTAALDRTGLFETAPSVMYGGKLKNVEVNSRGVHKGRGLEALAGRLGCGMEGVLALGDSDNDLSMLRMAGLGVAMENALPSVRAAADAVTASNLACGVARAIEKYVLKGM